MILLPVSGKELQRDTERAVTIIFLYIWGERERGPLLWTRRTRCHDILYIYIRPAPATAHARRYAQTYVSSRLNLRSRSPQNAQHFTSYWGERERGPLLWTQRTRCHDRRYIYIYTAGTRYCACAALRANVAGRIGNRFSPAESAFLVPSATSLTLAP